MPRKLGFAPVIVAVAICGSINRLEKTTPSGQSSCPTIGSWARSAGSQSITKITFGSCSVRVQTQKMILRRPNPRLSLSVALLRRGCWNSTAPAI